MDPITQTSFTAPGAQRGIAQADALQQLYPANQGTVPGAGPLAAPGGAMSGLGQAAASWQQAAQQAQRQQQAMALRQLMAGQNGNVTVGSSQGVNTWGGAPDDGSV